MTTLLDYLEAARDIVAVNPKHQTLVNRFAFAHRKVDFHVDAASIAADNQDSATENRHLRQEEKWFNVALGIEELLPARELANVWKQLQANIFSVNLTDDAIGSKESAANEITIRVTKQGTSADEVAKYLPSNYRVDAVVKTWILVKGNDNAGWTAEGYVIPRLASGRIQAVVERSSHERLNENLYAGVES